MDNSKNLLIGVSLMLILSVVSTIFLIQNQRTERSQFQAALSQITRDNQQEIANLRSDLNRFQNTSTHEEIVPKEQSNQPFVLFRDTKHDLTVQISQACKDIYTVRGSANEFYVFFSDDTDFMLYGYGVLSEKEYQKEVEERQTQGVEKKAQLPGGLFLVSFQPQDMPSEIKRTISGGELCPYPSIVLPDHSVVEDF